MAGPLPPQHCQVLLLLWERCMSVMVSVLQVSIPLWRNISSGSSSAGRNQTSEWVKKHFHSLCHSWSQNVFLTYSSPVVFYGLWKREWKVTKSMQSVLHPVCVCAAVWRLTGGAQGGFDEGFRSGGYWLDWPGLFGCQLFQTHSSLVKHVLHR